MLVGSPLRIKPWFLTGHGPNGENVALYIANHLCDLVLEQYQTGNFTFAEAIETACLTLDEQMRNSPELVNEDGFIYGGSTCCAMWITTEEIYSCNIGERLRLF